jgi:hypothetical protein
MRLTKKQESVTHTQEKGRQHSQLWWYMPVILHSVESWVWDQPGLHSKFKSSLGYAARTCLKTPRVKDVAQWQDTCLACTRKQEKKIFKAIMATNYSHLVKKKKLVTCTSKFNGLQRNIRNRPTQTSCSKYPKWKQVLKAKSEKWHITYYYVQRNIGVIKRRVLVRNDKGSEQWMTFPKAKSSQGNINFTRTAEEAKIRAPRTSSNTR